MTSYNLIKSRVFFACFVVFIFTGCVVTPSNWRGMSLDTMCNFRYRLDNSSFTPSGHVKNKKKDIDTELKRRGKDCGCYYQAWDTAHLSMGVIGLALQSNASKHCEKDNPAEVK